MTDSEHDPANPLRLVQEGINQVLNELSEMRLENKLIRDENHERLTRLERTVDDHTEKLAELESKIESEPKIALTVQAQPAVNVVPPSRGRFVRVSAARHPAVLILMWLLTCGVVFAALRYVWSGP
jgi:hypothetical protein